MLEKLLKSEEYLRDKVAFTMIDRILLSDTLEYYTDGENYLICRSNPTTPIWVWNKDDISENKVNEILIKLDNMLDEDNVIQNSGQVLAGWLTGSDSGNETALLLHIISNHHWIKSN
jgi:hypothetical protein